MVLREHKRFKVLNLQSSHENMLQLNKERQRAFITSARQSAQYDQQLKQSHEQKKIDELKHRYSINLKHRETNRKMIESVKKSFMNANHELYEQIRLKKQENENAVSMKRSFYAESRSATRKQAELQRNQRRQSIQNFYDSRVQETRIRKEQQVQELLRASQERHRFYEALSSRNSRIKENQLSMSRSLSNSSLRNPENRTLQART